MEFCSVSQDRCLQRRGGAGDYIPGLYASLINITPNQPGFALGTGYLFYTGSIGTSATLPFGGILASKIGADVSLGNRTKTVSDGANGISDIFLVPFALNWTFGDLQVNPQFFMVAPTGDYQKGQLANAGKNHWMFDWLLGLSYLSHKTGT